MALDMTDIKHLLRHEAGQDIRVRPEVFRITPSERLAIEIACERIWTSSCSLLIEISDGAQPPAPFEKHAPFWSLIHGRRRQHPLFFSRFDFRLRDGQPQFLELNTNCPAGGGFFAQWRHQALGSASIDVGDFLSEPMRFVDTIIDVARQEARDSRELNIVLATDNGGLTLELPYLRELFRRRGHQAEIAEVPTLSRDGNLLVDSFGRPVDLVYCKCNLVQSDSPGWSIAYRKRCADFIDVWKQGGVTVLNPPPAILLAEDKAFLRLLRERDPSLKKWIPMTKILAELTPPELSDVKLAKDNWVLKPRQESRGRGVVCGPDVPSSFWLSALANCTPNEYVVQHYVPEQNYPDQSRTMTALMLQGKVGGVFNRVSRGPINNVAAGAEIEIVVTAQ